MTDDNVLAALDAFIAGFGTGKEDASPFVAPTTAQPIDNNSSTKTTNHIRNRTLRENDVGKKILTNLSRSDDDHRIPSTDVACGFCGYTVEHVGSAKATSDIAQAARVMRWHLDHSERLPHALCAGCRRPIREDEEAWILPDDNRVRIDNDYRCLIAVAGRGARRDQGNSPADRGSPAWTCVLLHRLPPTPALTCQANRQAGRVRVRIPTPTPKKEIR